MASIQNILFLFAILVSSTVTLAQGPNSNDSRSDEAPANPPHGHGNGSDEEPPQASSAPGMFDHFPFRAPKIDWREFPGAGLFSSGSRHKRSIDRRVIRCNYASEGGFRCTGCHTVRRCYPFNRGTDSTCSGLFQYCNNGQCSRTKGSQCSDTTSTSTSASTSSSSTSSTASSSSSSSSSSSTTESSTSSSSTSTKASNSSSTEK